MALAFAGFGASLASPRNLSKTRQAVPSLVLRASSPCSSSEIAVQHTAVPSQAPADSQTVISARRLELESQARAALDADSKWWQEGVHVNLRTVLAPAQYKAALASAQPGQLVVVNYFAPHCNGCRRLYPKFQHIVAKNPDVLFIKVNTNSEAMNETCESLGVDRLPWFQLIRDGVAVASFTANLSTISRVRSEVKRHNPGRAGDSDHGVPVSALAAAT